MPGTYLSLPSGYTDYWHDAVANVAALPAAGNTSGETRLVLSDGSLRYWSGAAWVIAAPGAAVTVTGPASSTNNGLVRWNGTTGNVVKDTSAVSLTTEVTGTLPAGNGGTGSAAVLNNNRVVKTSAGTLVEAAAITAGMALVSDANGIPTHTAVTTAEIGYVSGVTSAIQTQLAAKAIGAGTVVDKRLARFSGTGGNQLSQSLVGIDDTGNLTGAISAVVGSSGALTAGAALEVSSTTKTFLLPRMNTTQRDALAAAPDGSLIYNSQTNKIQGRENGAWVDLTGWGS